MITQRLPQVITQSIVVHRIHLNSLPNAFGHFKFVVLRFLTRTDDAVIITRRLLIRKIKSEFAGFHCSITIFRTRNQCKIQIAVQQIHSRRIDDRLILIAADQGTHRLC